MTSQVGYMAIEVCVSVCSVFDIRQHCVHNRFKMILDISRGFRAENSIHLLRNTRLLLQIEHGAENIIGYEWPGRRGVRCIV